MKSAWGNSSRDDPELTLATVISKSVIIVIIVLWTIFSNGMVFVVLYKAPRLRTVPNFLVANLAFSDLLLSLLVLPLSGIYAVTYDWLLGKTLCELWLSIDIFVCTASIWNLSVIGLDRYWAITSPVTYMAKRNVRTAAIMIVSVWVLSAAISIAPFLGWKAFSTMGNYVHRNETNSYDCIHFEDLPSFTIYSAVGSFWIPLFVMFFVYWRIFRAFQDHKARQIYRQKVIKKSIESTILKDISFVCPTSDEFGASDIDEDDEEDDDNDDEDSEQIEDVVPPQPALPTGYVHNTSKENAPTKGILTKHKVEKQKSEPPQANRRSNKEMSQRGPGSHRRARKQRSANHLTIAQGQSRPTTLTFEKIARHKRKKEARKHMRKSLQKKPAAISAAKEKRGVKVLGIILGCFALCWTPFFIMYLLSGFCRQSCTMSPNIVMFITWLGYVNSGINPIIYTVFNRDYQIALKQLLRNETNKPRKAAVKL